MTIEKLIAVGDCIYDFHLPNSQSAGVPGFVNQGVVDASFRVMRVTQTIAKHWFWKDEIIEEKEHSQIYFRWLPWVSSKINYAEAGGKDVLSGMFTGCWMVRYKTKEGSYRVAHVATDAGHGDCKALWRQSKASMTDVKEFRPDIGFSSANNLGLVTSTGDLYKVELETGGINILIKNPWRTPQEWHDNADPKILGNDPEFMANHFSKKTNILANQAYLGNPYRVSKIVGPVAAEVFPE